MAIHSERPLTLPTSRHGPAPSLDGHLLTIIAGGRAPTTGRPPTAPARRRVARYRRFLDALGVAVYTTDADGRITFYNAAAAEFWGRRPELGEEWCGSWRLTWLDGAPMRHDECPMAICLKEERVVRGYQAVAMRPDGTSVVFVPYPTPLFDDSGRMLGAVNVLVDVTERHHAEEQVRATARALEVSNAVKDEFLGLVSHELRTPVTTILGNARLLETHGDDLDAAVKASMVADIAADADRLHTIIENLIHLTRLGAGSRPDLEPQLLDRVVRRSVTSFRERHPKRQIRLVSESPGPIVDAEDAHLQLLLENLLSNAVKFSPSATPVDVRVSTVGPEARVTVRDRGIGLDDLPPEMVFQPFRRSTAAISTASGLGIGLALCQRSVEALGGRIWARPRRGDGAEVGFALPIANEAREAS